MAVEICFLLATERSGTHMLRSLLAKVAGVSAPGEICNAASEEIRTAETSYLKFRERACTENQDFFFPTGNIQTKLLDQFFAHIREIFSEKKLVVLDVKYSHVHNFNSFWWDVFSRPFLLDYARERQIKIIHLVREKVYQTVISHNYAQKSGVWRAKRPDEIGTLKIAVDRKKLENKARGLARTINLFDEWMAGSKHFRLAYENLTDNPQNSLLELGNFLGLESEIPYEPGFIKTTPPYIDSIENFDEIAHLVDLGLSDLKKK